MSRTDVYIDQTISFQRRRSGRTAMKRRSMTKPSPSLLPCKMPKTDTDPYSNENVLATLQKLEEQSAERIKRSKQIKCVELTAILVDFFGDKVISPNLSRRVGNWHYDVRNQLKLDNINCHRSELVQQVEQIAISKGLTEKQWQCLIYLTLSMGESRCMNMVTCEHLNEVRMMSSVLEYDDHKTVCALIDAIDEHVMKN